MQCASRRDPWIPQGWALQKLTRSRVSARSQMGLSSCVIDFAWHPFLSIAGPLNVHVDIDPATFRAAIVACPLGGGYCSEFFPTFLTREHDSFLIFWDLRSRRPELPWPAGDSGRCSERCSAGYVPWFALRLRAGVACPAASSCSCGSKCRDSRDRYSHRRMRCARDPESDLSGAPHAGLGSRTGM